MMQRGMKHGRARAVTVFALIVALFVLTLAPAALAWDDCPKGLVNDPYPGACSRYVDTNDDGICDRSQPAPTATTDAPTTTAAPTTTLAPTTSLSSSTTSAAASSTTGAVAVGDTSVTGDEGDGLAAAGTAVAAAGLTTPPSGGSGTGGTGSTPDGSGGSATGSADGTTEATPLPSNTSKAVPTIEYNLSPIAIAFLLVYLVSFILYRTHRIRVTTHRKIWNVLLLITFLMTGVLGMLLVVQLNWGVRFNLPFDMLFWHVETGIVMSLISFFHIGWHLKYYRNLLRRRHERHETATQPQPAAAAACRARREAARGSASAGGSGHNGLRPVRPYPSHRTAATAASPAAAAIKSRCAQTAPGAGQLEPLREPRSAQGAMRPLRSVPFERDAE